MKRKAFEKEVEPLELELAKLQESVQRNGAKIAILFEGRDAAGKGGLIKTIMRRMNPRVWRIVALPKPSDRERTQWYFQRYVAHLPAAGEIVLFDRSWYNRAVVEPVMGFCTIDEHEAFMREAPLFERMIVDSGTTLIKYWLHVSAKEQERRFEDRARDPRKRWKLSPIDLEGRRRWAEFTRARDKMLDATHTDYAPWRIVPADDKWRARLNCIRSILEVAPYDFNPAAFEPISLPPRQKPEDVGYKPKDLPREMMITDYYGKG